jgi:23S rRNA pseudouridine2605 synthase
MQGPDRRPGERLQKVLAREGHGSRREIEAWIRAGRLTVNGLPAVLGVRVGPGDRIQLDGRPLRQRSTTTHQVFLCHRSPGENLREPDVTAARDDVTREALETRLPRRAGRRFITVSPMPRADGGLEILTSDGELAARLQHAVRSLTSELSARVRGELTDEQRSRVLEGELDSGERIEVLACEPAGGEGANRWYRLEARGASGREVRQVLERQGAFVSRMLRTRLGPLQLERALARGQFRKLSESELRAFLGEVTPDSRTPVRSRRGSPDRRARRKGR